MRSTRPGRPRRRRIPRPGRCWSRAARTALWLRPGQLGTTGPCAAASSRRARPAAAPPRRTTAPAPRARRRRRRCGREPACAGRAGGQLGTAICGVDSWPAAVRLCSGARRGPRGGPHASVINRRERRDDHPDIDAGMKNLPSSGAARKRARAWTMMVPAAAGGAGCDAIDVSHRHNTAVFDLGSIGTRTLAATSNGN